MFSIKRIVFLASCLLPALVNAGGAPTDSYRDADEMQSSYLDNHNMDPSIVGSPAFGMIWSKTYKPGEEFYAKPLIFTSSKGLNGNKPVAILCSALNNIYVEDAKNAGNVATIKQRNLAFAFTQADADNCPDLGGPCGIIGTPVIDPQTEIMYLFSKSYAEIDGSLQGTANGRYRFHAIDLNSPTLADLPGYPIFVDGAVADNDPAIHFFGGVAMQRPALLMKNGVVYGGFGSHCDKWNFTGAVIGVNVAEKRIVSYFSTEISPWLLPAGQADWKLSSGQGGIWMGGCSLSSDSGSRLFFTTGNGKGKQAQKGQSLSGKSFKLATLGEAVVNLRIGSDGKLELQDWFQPYDYALFDNNDEDLGSAGVMMLDTNTFKGTGVSKMAITYGKNAYMYVMNADNLGGFGNGPGGGDYVIQTINTGASTFGGSGSYPLDGGYIYFVPSTTPLQAYKLGFKADGTPQFSFAGASASKISGRIGPPVITSYKGQPGTGIVWVADNNAGLLAFRAVPENGQLVKLNTPATGGLNKFQRPAFGDGTVYVTNSNGKVMCLGSPVNLPLNCSSIDFGNVPFGTSKVGTVTCQTTTSLRVDNIVLSDAMYTASNSSLPTAQLAANAEFSFQVTWNAPSNAPGVRTGTVTINVTPAQANQFTNSIPIGLRGDVVSNGAYINISPVHYSFNPIIVGTPAEPAGQAGTFQLGNAGLQAMKILGYYYSEDGGPYKNITTNSTNPDYKIVGTGFNVDASSLPSVGSTIAPNTQMTVSMHFYAVNGQSSDYGTAFYIATNGGTGRITLSGTASSSPKAEVAVATVEGFWNTNWREVHDFHSLQAIEGNVAFRTMRVCNRGGSVLAVTKSKPVSTPYLYADIETVFPEGLQIAPGDCAYGNVTFTPGLAYVNTQPKEVTGVFVLNFNDESWGGEQFVHFAATIMPKQVGPLNGVLAQYQFAGCYKDSTCGTAGTSRCFSQDKSSDTNTAEECIAKCKARNLPIAATQYTRECWCGSALPRRAAPNFIDDLGFQSKCNFVCPGDKVSPLQFCGGQGQLMNVYYDPEKLTISSISTTMQSTTAPATTSTTITTTTTSRTTTPQPTATIHNPGNVNYTWVGCVSEPVDGSRALPGGQQLGGQALYMSVDRCLEWCNGKKYIGLQYGGECYCGDVLVNPGPTVDEKQCNMACKGSIWEYCGGTRKFDMYQRKDTLPKSSTTLPPVVSSTTTTTTTTTTSTTSSTTSSTTTTTTTTTSSSATTATTTASTSSTTTTSTTTTTTTSRTTTTTTTTTSPSTTTTTTTTLSTTTSSRTTTTSATTQPSTTFHSTTTSNFITATAPYDFGYYYMGCYTETAKPTPHLLVKTLANDTMTIEKCLELAQDKKLNWAGLEYGRECWLGSIYPSLLMSTTGTKACTMTCKGNPTQKCGGQNQLNIYYSPPPPTATPQRKKRRGKQYGDF